MTQIYAPTWGSYFVPVPKGEKGNITKNELEGFKVMAKAFLSLNDDQINILIGKQNLIEVL